MRLRSPLSRPLVLTGLCVLLAATSATRAQSTWPGTATPLGAASMVDSHGRRATATIQNHVTGAPKTSSLVPSSWQALGPFGGDIQDVQVSPLDNNLVLAALAPSSGGGGLERSTNGGASWSPVASLADVACYCIAFAPDGTAYVGTIDGVWKSTNAGASFTAQGLGIGPNDQVSALVVDPTDPQRLWCGIADYMGFQPVMVMLSVNGGTSWTNKSPPLANPLGCNGIAVDPANNQHVYAAFGGAFGGGKVWATTNGGTSWVNHSPGLPNNPMQDVVFDGSRVLVCGGQLFGTQNVGLYSSVNDGVTWTPVHDGTWPVLAINDIGLDPNDPSTILVASAGQGVFRSIDDGVSWDFQVGGTGSLSVNSVSFAPGSSSTIFTGSSSVAVWKSTDGGASFAASSTGIGALDTYSIGSNPLNENELAIAFQGQNNGGVFTTLDGGQSWSLEALPPTRYSSVRFDASGQLFAISSGPSSIAPEGLYRRTGAIWTPIGPDQGSLYESDLFSMRFSSNDPDLIWASGADFGVAGFEPTIWRTTTGGLSWSKVYEGAVANKTVRDLHVVDPAADSTLVAAFTDTSGGSAGGALRSIDGGVTWVPSGAGLSASVQGTSLASSPVGAGLLFLSSSLAGQPGVYASADGGQSWSSTGYVGEALAVVADQHVPNTLYISRSNASKVQVSIDGGASFAPHNLGLATAGFVRALQPSLGPGNELLLASGTGAYATNVAFAPPWTNLESGLVGLTGIPSLVGNGTLVAGTSGVLGLTNARPSSLAALFVSLSSTPSPFKGGILVTVPVTLTVSVFTNALGSMQIPWAAWPASLPSGTNLYFQYAIKDAAAVQGVALSNGLKAVTP
jgi:hypothetical protein